MKKYCMWVELEYEDGGRIRSHKEFNSLEERENYISKNENRISDLELYERGE